MYAPAAGASAGFLEHFFGALWGVFSGDLASFFGGDIDDIHPAGPAAWVHAVVAMLAVAILIYRNRAAIARFLQSRQLPADIAAGRLRDRVPGHVRRREILAAGTPHAALPAAALSVRQHRHRDRGRGLDGRAQVGRAGGDRFFSW